MPAAVRFSDLKALSRSPAHYRHRVNRIDGEQTRAMRIGTYVHHLVLGPRADRPMLVFPGDRRAGAKWDAFLADARDAEILTAPEAAEATPLAEAVLAHPIAREMIGPSRREVPLQWDDAGIACHTGGIDVVGDGFIADLKTTTCTEPAAFMRHATRLQYHAQMAWYETGANANGIDTSKGLFIIGVEVTPPYVVTVMRLTDATRDQGRKTCALWLERLRACRENDHWPGYSQTVVDYELPAWFGDGDDDDEG